MLDSMYMNIKNAERFGYNLQAKWNTPVNNSSVLYRPAMPTIQELKNSGSLRLIREKDVAQKIMLYETSVNGSLHSNGEGVQQAMNKIFAFEDDYCNYDDFNKKTSDNLLDSLSQMDLGNAASFEMPLIIKDPVKLNGFANAFVNYKAVAYGYYTQTNHVKKIAVDLINLINQNIILAFIRKTKEWKYMHILTPKEKNGPIISGSFYVIPGRFLWFFGRI